MSVSLLVDLLSYWNYTNIGIATILDEMFFWNFLDTFFRLWYTSSKYFLFSCMSVSLLVDLLPYWYYTNIGIAPILDEIFFWNFSDTFFRLWYTSFTSSVLCVSVCFLLLESLTEIKKTLWNLHIWMKFFWFLRYSFGIHTNCYLYVCQSVCVLTSIMKLGNNCDISTLEWYPYLKLLDRISSL